jgi:hypothetical protein
MVADGTRIDDLMDEPGWSGSSTWLLKKKLSKWEGPFADESEPMSPALRPQC